MMKQSERRNQWAFRNQYDPLAACHEERALAADLVRFYMRLAADAIFAEVHSWNAVSSGQLVDYLAYWLIRRKLLHSKLPDGAF